MVVILLKLKGLVGCWVGWVLGVGWVGVFCVKVVLRVFVVLSVVLVEIMNL